MFGVKLLRNRPSGLAPLSDDRSGEGG